ncbi:T-cell receptor gamma chain V region 5/10-13 [Myotis brandtii]|nr:T-cell receptor gamma chain V region 5/10-13 [Myotis brandtii]
MPPLEAVIFLSLWAFGLGQLKLEQPELSISWAKGESAQIPCKVSSSTFSRDYIHWYQQKQDQSIEHLIYVVSTVTVFGKNNKLMARKYSQTSTSTLTINFLEKEDEAVYFCACWTGIHSVRDARITCTSTIFRSVPTHILLNIGNHRGCTAGHQPEPPSPRT